MPRKTYWNCAAYGCLNTPVNKPGLAVFRLPSDIERRSKWLQSIAREDLINKPPQNYAICEEHFSPLAIIQEKHRKTLKNHALPFLKLNQKKDVATLTESPALVEKCIQTEQTLSFNEDCKIQITKSLISDCPSKRKQNYPLKCEKKRKLMKSEIETKNNDAFSELCDTYLTGELAELVKGQTYLELVEFP